MGTGRRGARWFAAVLGVALVASAVVVYLLIRVTAPAADGDQGLTAVSSELTATTTSEEVVSSTPDSTTGSTARTSGGSAEASPSTTPEAPTAHPTATTGLTPSEATTSDVSDTATTSPTTSTLPGSDVPLPAAWSGTADVEITITGDCPGAKPTHYTTPADIALDVAGGGASVTETGPSQAPSGGAEPTLTIGVNTAAVPSVAVYSATVDNTGVFHQFWSLSLASSGSRTDVSGFVVDDDTLAGNNPNLLVDALQPPESCATVPVSGLPRVLAIGSSLSGWVDAGAAQFTLHAVTTDGQRSLTVTIAATRSQ